MNECEDTEALGVLYNWPKISWKMMEPCTKF